MKGHVAPGTPEEINFSSAKIVHFRLGKALVPGNFSEYFIKNLQIWISQERKNYEYRTEYI
jgi:hypothetical protein